MSTGKLTDRERFYDVVMGRAKEAFSCKTWAELAELLGLSTGDLSNRKKRGAIPYDKLIEVASSRSVSFDWLLTGEGEPIRSAVAGGELGTTAVPAARDEADLLMLYRQLDDSSRREVRLVVEGKKRMLDMEARLAELIRAVGVTGKPE